MSECTGSGCGHPECRQPKGRVDTPPAGVAPEKWAVMSRRERRALMRGAGRGRQR